ncbi:hypothetical protein [Hyphomicrobium sp. D-2]|uniref:hypothetical protein n=1 Tax=Hyphomicrobium sp. D-2 TaxID=3041621 RepID=UPI0024570AF7|nr:hypothetical protein [Hyphomicrobium sp. D-2]MDH4982934.1 hypothetical protein [Hyphomicrobium sp. D-2]
MNKIALIAATVVTAVAATSVAASAGSINRTQDRQLDRIEQGRKSGSITWTEGLKLRAEQKRIANRKAQLNSKGYLTKSDRRELNSMQRDASYNITKERHDTKRRPTWLPRVGK